MNNIWNKYKKIAIISLGRYNTIYKAKKIKEGNYVAIKEINKDKYKFFTGQDFNEKNIEKIINIENSVKVLEKINLGKNYYLVMDLCLISLQDYLNIRNKGLSINEIKEILIQLNSILSKIKEKEKLIVKPSNILLSLNKINKISIQLTTFNFQKENQISSNIENKTNESILDNDNIWNLGIMIYYMLNKEFLYKKDEIKIKLNEIKDEDLIDLLKKMLKIKIQERISWNNYFNHSFFNNNIFPKFKIICEIHSEEFNHYCKDCKKNICVKCLNEHSLNSHQIISFFQIGLNENENNEFTKAIKVIDSNLNELNSMKQNIKLLMSNLAKIKDKNEIYENDLDNNFKQYYINCLNIMNEKLKIKTIKIIDIYKSSIDCVYKISKEILNQETQIINYISESNLEQLIEEDKQYGIYNNELYINDEDIKKNFDIYVNNKNIKFQLTYNFENEGNNFIKIIMNKQIKSISCLFRNCFNLINIDFSQFNTNDITNMNNMFYNCKSLKNIDLSNFNTENVTDFSCMFVNCFSLKEINLSKFKTYNCVEMSGMFYNCTTLEYLNLFNFDTINVVNMCCMFYKCNSLIILDLSNFNTSKVTNMACMFQECYSLKKLNVSNFNTNKVKKMNYMFINCSSLQNLELSNFNTNNVINMERMFYGCSSLIYLNISNFKCKVNNNITSMFLKINKECDIKCNDKKILSEFKNNK